MPSWAYQFDRFNDPPAPLIPLSQNPLSHNTTMPSIDYPEDIFEEMSCVDQHNGLVHLMLISPFAISNFVLSDRSPSFPQLDLQLLDDDPPFSPTLPQDTAQPESIQRSSYTESLPTKPTRFPLDELYPPGYFDCADNSSDEEIEEVPPGDPSTSSPVPQPERDSCLWKGCSTEFNVGTPYDTWEKHIESAHVEHGRGRLPKVTTCQWGTCSKGFRNDQGILPHVRIHLRQIESPCPLGCGKSLSLDDSAVAKHMKRYHFRGR